MTPSGGAGCPIILVPALAVIVILLVVLL